MSKTDKTNPIWVGRKFEPSHRVACRFYVPRSKWQRVDEYVSCTLPMEPPIHYTTPGWRHGRETCTWEPILPSAYRGQYTSAYARPRAVRENANKIERRIRTEWRNHRQKLLAACVEPYELLNEDEYVPPDPRHRNFALWDMW